MQFNVNALLNSIKYRIEPHILDPDPEYHGLDDYIHKRNLTLTEKKQILACMSILSIPKFIDNYIEYYKGIDSLKNMSTIKRLIYSRKYNKIPFTYNYDLIEGKTKQVITSISIARTALALARYIENIELLRLTKIMTCAKNYRRPISSFIYVDLYKTAMYIILYFLSDDIIILENYKKLNKILLKLYEKTINKTITEYNENNGDLLKIALDKCMNKNKQLFNKYHFGRDLMNFIASEASDIIYADHEEKMTLENTYIPEKKDCPTTNLTVITVKEKYAYMLNIIDYVK